MYPGRCIKCGAFDGLGENDAMCESCYEQTRWEEITAINCNPQVDDDVPGEDDDQDDEDAPICRECGQQRSLISGTDLCDDCYHTIGSEFDDDDEDDFDPHGMAYQPDDES